MEEAQRLTNQKLRKRRFVGSGFVALQKAALGPASSLDGDAQLLLQKLLHQHGVDIDTEVANASNADKIFGSTVAPPGFLDKKAAETDSDDAEILKGAQSGEISLFLTILKTISDGGFTPVSTKELFKACCLAVRARDVPGSMDAKGKLERASLLEKVLLKLISRVFLHPISLKFLEMVMAALQFMSRDCEMSSEDLISLPLIRPSQELADLERRTFTKCGDWTMDDDFKENVLRLEQIFTSSSSSWRWLKREFAAPRLAQKDEDSLFLKGVIPASAVAKKPTPQVSSRKRKANAMASSETDGVASPGSVRTGGIDGTTVSSES